MLFRIYARSFFSTASCPRRSDLGNLLPTVKHKKAMPRTKRSPRIRGAERFINRSSEETILLYPETTDLLQATFRWLCRRIPVHLTGGLRDGFQVYEYAVYRDLGRVTGIPQSS